MIKSKLENDSPLIEIEMYPAGYGDSLLVSVNMEGDEKINLLIDCGLGYTFHQVLKNKLSQLGKNGECLSRLIITHIDADHINGALPLLKQNGLSGDPNIIKIEQIWHNTFRHLQFEKNQAPLNFQEREVLNGIIAVGFPKKKERNSSEIEIGAKNSMTLGALILEKNYSWNEDSFGKAICSDLPFQNNIHEDIEISILSPSINQLERLTNEFINEIEKMGIGEVKDDELFDDAFEYLVSRLEPLNSKEKEVSIDEFNIPNLSDDIHFKEDGAAPNGSSIAFVLKIADKKLLFLGDAHPSQIELELKKIYPVEHHNYPIFFDAIKVSHHGSNGNTSPSLLKIIDSDKFLFSTNGISHKHPDRETIARIVDRPTKYIRNLYFNFETETSNAFNNANLKSDFNYEVIYPENRIKI